MIIFDQRKSEQKSLVTDLKDFKSSPNKYIE